MFEADRSRSRSSEQAPQLRVVVGEPGPPHWTGLADAGNEAVFCSAWLSSQCTRISGIIAGLLMMPPPAKGLSVAATSWPQRNPYIEDLLRLAERASLERRAIVSPGRMGSDTSVQPVGRFVALPLGPGSQPIAVAAVALASGSSAALAPESVAEQLRWGAGWLEALPWARRSEDASTDVARAASSLDFLAAIGEQPRLQGMAIAAANDLAARLRCDRVAVGLIRRNGSIRLRAISHSASFKGQGRLVDAIENAMEEALDQRSSVAYPPVPSTERAVTMAHRTLTEIIRVQGTSLISVVMADSKGKLVGAITFERRNELFDKEALQLAEAIAALLGPIVGLQLRANRLLAGRIIDRADDGFISLFGPRRPGLKLGVIGVIGLALFLALAKGEHRVTAKSVLEGEVQRAAVAPFDGFIRSAPVRAGDTVRAGDVLSALEDRDLILDRLKWRAERDKLVQKQREVRAKHDRTNLVILDSQIRQAESQLALAEEKLSRARILAPFDGIVVSGDLSQMLGSPVERGKLLFEIAPLNSYRLIIHVDERDVRYVAMGQSGTIAFAGVPWTPLRMILSKITPVTVAEEGRNSFRIEARLTEPSPNLRPGMEGVAKIETGQRSMVWIWTRAVVEWLRLVAWKYLP
jgi:Barrel-sandwich domain of CusB or HlyD membrane-fusion/GAF domain